MKMRLALAALLTLATLHASAHELSCVDFFASAPTAAAPDASDPSTVSLPLRPMDLTFEPGAPSRSDSLSQLLEMYLSMPFQGEGPKDFKKGTLHLARALPNGDSLELKYEADQRSGELMFRLSEISRTYKSGYTESLEKRPLTDDGSSLRIAAIPLTVDETAALEKLHFEPIEIPTEIKGELLSALKSWIDRFPLLSIGDARKAITQSGEVVQIVSWQASLKSGLILFGKTAKKQAFKAFLYSMIFVGVQQLPNVGNLLQYLPGYGRVSRLLRGEKNDAGKAQEEILKSVLSSDIVSDAGSAREAYAIQSRFAAELAREKDLEPLAITQQIQALSTALVHQEKSAGGKTVVYMQDVDDSKGTNVQKRIASAGGRSIIVESFPKQSQILLIPIVRSKSGAVVPSYVQISRKDSPRTYAGLESMIKKQIANK